MSAERPTFSPFWHRVRTMRPRLRPNVQSTRQFYRGQRWHVVHDPSSNQFYRLNPVAYEFVALLDGRRTVEEVWQLALANHGDDAPTQHESIQLISQLYSSNLLSVDDSPEVEQLLRRSSERRAKFFQQQAIGLMYFKFRLFNPDRILTAIEPILRPLLNRWGFVAWAVFVLSVLTMLIPHWGELKTGVDQAITSTNWGWLMAVFVVTKLWHETGHGVICKRFGGNVPEFGLMMLVLLPSPFVDASACWTFQSKWRRMAVGAGGMIFELFLAGVAGIIWLNVPDGLLRQMAYNAMFTASVSTILFNANPLMRFDGYYILSDLLEIPNLQQRSTAMLKWFFEKFVYRIKEATPPTSVPDEQVWLTIYGIASFVYRIFVFLSITLYLLGKLFAIGVFLAIWSAAAWFLIPVGGFVHWLATDQRLGDHRLRAVATSLLLIVSAFLIVGVIPAPDRRRGEGVIESVQKSGIFAKTDGFVDVVHKRPGEFVRKGEPIVTMISKQLEARMELLTGMLKESEAKWRDAIVTNPAAAQIAEQKVETLLRQRDVLLQKQKDLVVRAPHDGVIVTQDPVLMLGTLVKEGKPICDLVDPRSIRFVAAMSQEEALWLYERPREDYSVEMRLVSNVGHTFDGGSVRVIDAGQRRLAHQSLSYLGGGNIEVEQSREAAGAAKDPLFEVQIDPRVDPEGRVTDWPGLPGERVKVRFALKWRPLAGQWVDRMQKLIYGRVNL